MALPHIIVAHPIAAKLALGFTLAASAAGVAYNKAHTPASSPPPPPAAPAPVQMQAPCGLDCFAHVPHS